jgi:hypothetical protein
MKSINEYIDQELRWVHPDLRRSEYELRAGDEVLVRASAKGFQQAVTLFVPDQRILPYQEGDPAIDHFL